MIIVDSSGWIEYLTNGSNASTFAPIIADAPGMLVPTIALYEVFKFILRVEDQPAADRAALFMTRSQVIELDAALALDAALLSATHRLPMADSIILATARRFVATLWTQDVDFAGLDGVRYFAKA